MHKIWKDITLLSFAICFSFNIFFEFFPFKKSINSIENIFSLDFDGNLPVSNTLVKLKSYPTLWNNYGYTDISTNQNIKFYESMTSPIEQFTRSVKGCFIVASLKFKQNVLFRIFTIGNKSHKINHKIKENFFIYSNLNESSFQNTIIKSGYFIGIIIGSLFLPFIFWCIRNYFLFQEKKIEVLKTNEKLKKQKIVESHSVYGGEFRTKNESLLNLLKSKLISKEKYNIKLEQLIENCYEPIIIEQNLEKLKKIKEDLDIALKLGTITKDEYEKQIKSANYRLTP